MSEQPVEIDQYVLAMVGMNHADTEMMPDNSIRGKTWLQKMLYIASKSVGHDLLFDKYGKYLQAVDESMLRCSRAGLLCMPALTGTVPFT